MHCDADRSLTKLVRWSHEIDPPAAKPHISRIGITSRLRVRQNAETEGHKDSGDNNKASVTIDHDLVSTDHDDVDDDPNPTAGG